MNAYAPGLSLCMIVRDEERFLEEALRSVQGVVDEICVVDTGSTDRTIAIARSYGARVHEVAWSDDFSAARNAALALATRRWIVVLDADERVEPASRAALTAIGRTPAALRGKWIMCRNLADPNTGAGAMTNMLIRVFPNDPRIRYRNAIHEFIALDGSDSGLPADTTKIEIVHYGYLSEVVTQRRKGERNLRLSRHALEREPDDAFHHYNFGMASLLVGDRDAAIAALDRMRELTRDAPRGYRVHGLVVLADLYAEYRAESAIALELVAECLQYVPHYSNAHFTHGRILARAGNFFEARNAFGRAIAAGEYDAQQFVVDDEIAVWKAHSEIAGTLMRERRFEAALAWLEMATQARPAAQPLLINRAKCHEALGDLGAAGSLYAAAFRVGGDDASAVESINFTLRHESLEIGLEAIEAALPAVSAGCRCLLLGTAAATALQAGQLERAERSIERAIAADSVDARATLEALALHLKLPELRALIPTAPLPRAHGLHIAYVA